MYFFQLWSSKNSRSGGSGAATARPMRGYSHRSATRRSDTTITESGFLSGPRPPVEFLPSRFRCCAGPCQPKRSITEHLRGISRPGCAHSQVAMTLYYGKSIPASVAEEVEKL